MEGAVEAVEAIAAKATVAEAAVVVAMTAGTGEVIETTTTTTKVAVVAISHLATGVEGATNPLVATEDGAVVAATTDRPVTQWRTYATRRSIRRLSSSELALSCIPNHDSLGGSNSSLG